MPEPRFEIGARVAFGVVVIALGVLFTLDNLGLANAGQILRWWPALLVAWGLMRLTGFCCGRRVVVGALLTVAGTWMLLNEFGYLRQSVWDLWPIALIVLGASLLGGGLGRRVWVRPGTDPSSTLNAFALWSGADRKVTSADFRGGQVIAIMGGHDIDLRSAGLADGTAVIELLVVWGGVDLRVPENWRVSCEAIPIMAGVEDLSKPPAGEARGHLILRGLVVMGGVEVKN